MGYRVWARSSSSSAQGMSTSSIATALRRQVASWESTGDRDQARKSRFRVQQPASVAVAASRRAARGRWVRRRIDRLYGPREPEGSPGIRAYGAAPRAAVGGVSSRMARESPLLPAHERADALVMPYGGEGGVGAIPVVATYGELELEYAALRKGVALIDCPQRGVLEMTGAERIGFLNRMVTQELKGLGAGAVRRSFWLNRKGRIDADLRIVELGGRTLLEVDAHAAARTFAGLGSFIIMDDATIADRTEAVHRLSLHGPRAARLLAAVGAEALAALSPGLAAEAVIAGASCVAWREDSAGVPGFELIVPVADAAGVYRALVEAGHDPEHGAAALRAESGSAAREIGLRPAGWHAWNIARIEAGTPVYNIDFGPGSLPAETGVLDDRVSFTKGCFLGQEVVARMHSRGHSKQALVGVRFGSITDESTGLARLPEAGGTVTLASGEAVGAITSSTLAPMLGSAPIAFAAVKVAHAAAGTHVVAEVGGTAVAGAITAGLRFLAPA